MTIPVSIPGVLLLPLPLLLQQLMILLTLIPDLLLKHDAINTGLEERADRSGFTFEETESVEGEGGGRAGEVGQGF